MYSLRVKTNRNMTPYKIEQLQKIIQAPQGSVIHVNEGGRVTILSSLGQVLTRVCYPQSFQNCSLKVIALRIEQLIPSTLYDMTTPDLITNLGQRLSQLHPKKQENQVALRRLLDHIELIKSRLSHFVIRRDFVYDQKALHQSYLQKNAPNPLKITPLKIVNITTKESLEELIYVLKSWVKLSLNYLLLCSPVLRLNRWEQTAIVSACEQIQPDSRWSDLVKRFTQITRTDLHYQMLQTSFERNISAIQSFLYMIERSNSDETLLKRFTFCLALNEHSLPLGVCVTEFKKNRPQLCHIQLIASNPDNLVTPVVAGVGSAFIEYAVLQSLQAQKLVPHLLHATVMKHTGVTLYAVKGTDQFYRHIGFQNHQLCDSIDNQILAGDGLIYFLDKFGGRALSPK
jgi:hypothetical protein